jgi:hypothetical protein
MVQEAISPLQGRCSHRYPMVVSTFERGRRRARCLNCEALGPARPTLWEAVSALRKVRLEVYGPREWEILVMQPAAEDQGIPGSGFT